MEAKIPEVREKFLNKYSGSILDDTYSEADVDRVKKSDAFLLNAVSCHQIKGDVAKAVDLLNDILMFRAKMKLNDITEANLNKELMEKRPVYFKGKDKEGRNILHVKVCKSKRGHLVEEAKVIIAFTMFQHYKDHPDQQIVLLFDFVDAGVSNMDLDVTKFIVQCTSRHFPNILAYSLMFKMGVALEAIWKIIKGWLDAEQSKKTFFVKRANIQEYIDAGELEAHMIREEKDK